MRSSQVGAGQRATVRVKICGVTRVEDALAAEAAGADAIGLIFAARSTRRVTHERAREVSDALGPFMRRVGVFENAEEDAIRAAIAAARLDAVQLHGDLDDSLAASLRQSGVRVLRGLTFGPGVEPKRFEGRPFDGILLDGRMPGSGEAFEWEAARVWRGHPRMVLAGGLHPGSVGAAVRALRPYGVDVATGVESAPGIKDAAAIASFIRAVRTA